MAAVNYKGSHLATTIHLQTLVNFSRSVVRAEELALQHAMRAYEQLLYEQQRPCSKAA